MAGDKNIVFIELSPLHSQGRKVGNSPYLDHLKEENLSDETPAGWER